MKNFNTKPVFVVAALVLVVACAGKIFLLSTDPFPEVSSSLPLPLIWGAVFIDAFAAYVACSQCLRIEHKWLVLTFVFFFFLVVSTTRFLMGFQKCGCGGPIEIPQSVSIGVNLSMLTALAITRPRIQIETFKTFRSEFSAERASVLAGVLFSFVLFIALQSESVMNKTPWSNETQDLTAETTNVGDIVLDSTIQTYARISNHSMEPATVIGFQKSCSCLHIHSERTQIEPGETVSLAVVLRPYQKGRLWQQAKYYLECSKQQLVVTVDFIGFVKGKKND